MKKGLILTTLFASLIVLSLSSCGNSEEGKYEIKDIDIYRKNDSVDKKIGIRFYSDNPNVPYIGIKEYFKEFYNTDLTISKEDSFYNIKKNNETCIKIDPKNELLEIQSLYEFGKHPDYHSNNEKTYLKLDSTKTTNKTFKAINLNDYSILTYSSKNDVYVPVALLGNLYGGINGYNVAYNGKSLYVIDAYGELTEGVDRTDEYYADTYYNILTDNNKRFEDLVKYNYNQLCFTFDNLRGYTSQLLFGDHNLQTIGLNSLLETYHPEVKKLLLSTEKSDYEKGIMLLFGGLYDGGHTGLLSKNPPNTSYYQALRDDSKYKDLVNKFMGVEEKKLAKRQAFSDTKAIIFGVDYSSSKFGYHYDSTNKTAYIAFDTFVTDSKRWDQYYKGDKSKLQEMENKDNMYDTFAFVRKSLYDAKASGAKNVVLDLTTNGGGGIDAVMGVLGLINGAKAKETSSNTVDKTRSVKEYSIDINLDGKFDEEDVKEAKSFNFKIIGLTSSLAFSSGNYLPSLMSARGIKIIGEKSGGGSCCMIREATADGLLYARSGYSVLCDDYGNNVDFGVEVDYNLMKTNPDGSFNVSQFFDVKLVSEYMNNLK